MTATLSTMDIETQGDAPGEISRADLAEGLRELDKACPGYDRAENYYCGNIDELIQSLRLRKLLRQYARQYRINFANIPVDAVVGRLRIAAITAVGDPANTALQEVWTRNLMTLMSRELIRAAVKYGDAYLISWPDPDDDTAVDAWINDPQGCRLIYDDERPLVKRFGIKRWQAGQGDDARMRVDLYYPDRIEKLVTAKGEKGDDPGQYTRFFDDEGDAWPYENPYGEIPMFHFRTGAQYGTPEHKPFYPVQNTVFKLIVSHMAGVDYQILPQRYQLAESGAVGGDASDLDTDDFAIDEDPDPDEGSARLDSRPGGLWKLTNTKAVGQFDVAPHNVFTEPMLTYLRFGAQITDTPTHKIDPTGDHPSGESLRTAEGPFTSKCKDRQDWLEVSFAEWARFALKVRGHADASVSVRWEPVETVDDGEAWSVALQKIEAGVPLRQVLIEMNYPPDTVDEWFAPFDPDASLDVDLLLKIGQALQALGTAQSLGAVSPEQVQALITAVIGEEGATGASA